MGDTSSESSGYGLNSDGEGVTFSRGYYDYEDSEGDARDARLDALAGHITRNLPYHGGTLAVPAEHLTLFYAQAGNPTALHMARPTEDDLRTLVNTYPNGEIDACDFATKLELGTIQQLLDIGHPEFFQGDDEAKRIEAKPYKLNIYDQRLPFKPREDQILSDKFFGYLIITLPTSQGGALVVHHEGQDWTCDASRLARLHDSKIVYAVVSKDVVHEFLPVTSGFRVALTYKLYFADPKHPATGSIPVGRQHEEAFATQLHAVIRDATFLPEGGLLGFGLQHTYALPEPGTSVSGLSAQLRGVDAVVAAACKASGLVVHVKMHYSYGYLEVLRDSVLEVPHCEIDHEEYLTSGEEGAIVTGRSDEDSGRALKGDASLLWVTPMTEYSEVEVHFFFNYGGDTQMHSALGNPCLVVEIPKAEERNIGV